MSSACREVQRQIACIEAGAALPDELLKHLAACSTCAREGDHLQGVMGILSAEGVPDPGEPYWQAFLPRLRYRLRAQESSLAGRSGWRWAFSGAAASFMLIALLVGRWQIPQETRARLRLEQVAAANNPESLQQALDTLLPDMDPGVALHDGNDSKALSNDMSQALEEVFPDREADFEGSSPESARPLDKGPAFSSESGWV